MSITTFRRLGVVTAAAAATVAVTATSASAHHCFVPMYTLDGPTSSNWFVVSAEMGAGFEGYTAECDGASEAGYAAGADGGTTGSRDVCPTRSDRWHHLRVTTSTIIIA
jgi:hypothetical protein